MTDAIDGHWMRGVSYPSQSIAGKPSEMDGLTASGTLCPHRHRHGAIDNRMTCAIALVLFATGIVLSILLIGCYSRPFTGEVSIRPELLKQVLGKSASGP